MLLPLLLLVARFRGAIAFDLSFAGPWDRQADPQALVFGLGTKIGIGIGIGWLDGLAGLLWLGRSRVRRGRGNRIQLTMPMISFISHFGFIH